MKPFRFGKQQHTQITIKISSSGVLISSVNNLVSGQKPPGQKSPGQKPPGQKPPLPKTPQTKTPQRKLMNTKYILHK